MTHSDMWRYVFWLTFSHMLTEQMRKLEEAERVRREAQEAAEAAELLLQQESGENYSFILTIFLKCISLKSL